MVQNIPDNEIVSMFQRYLASSDPSEINKLKVEELVAAEARMGLRGMNSIFREVIKNKINDLKLKEARKYESRIRALKLVTSLILGLAIAGIVAWLFTP